MWLPLTCSLLGSWPITQAYALIGNRSSNPLVHRLSLNPLSYTGQGPNLLTLWKIILWILILHIASLFYVSGVIEFALVLSCGYFSQYYLCESSMYSCNLIFCTAYYSIMASLWLLYYHTCLLGHGYAHFYGICNYLYVAYMFILSRYWSFPKLVQ